MKSLNELQLIAIKYLPYNVSVVDGRHQQLVTTGTSTMRYRSIGLNFLGSSFDEKKLILRPFSDLIQEIEHNGKTITPLLEIAKIAGFDLNKSTIRTEGDSATGATYVVYGGVSRHPGSRKTFQNFFEIDEQDSDIDYGTVHTNGSKTDTRFYPVKNQLAIIEKLHEMKIDIYGAIKKGLAVSLHDIEGKIVS